MARDSDAIELDIAGKAVRITQPGQGAVLRAGRDQARSRQLLPLHRPSRSCARSAAGRCSWSATRTAPRASSFFQKRVPDNAPEWLETTIVSTPNGTSSRALVIADLAHVAWAVNLGCLGFHVWPARADDPDHADELRIDLDPTPGTDFEDARAVANLAHESARRARHRRASRRRRASTASTCTSGSNRGGIRTKCVTPRSRSRARWRVDIRNRSPTRGGRKSAASASSSTSTRTRRTRPCSARGACGRGRAGRCRCRSAWDELETIDPDAADHRVACPARVAERGDPWADDRHAAAVDRAAARDARTRHRQRPAGRALAARLPEDAGRAAPGVAQPGQEGPKAKPARSDQERK